MRRLDAPPQVPALPVIVVAAIGIAVNLGAAWLVRGGHGHAHDLNRRGAFLHLIADAAVSLAAVLAGVGMLQLGWSWLDPAVAEPEKLEPLLIPLSAALMQATPVSPRVNSVRNEGPECLEPAPIPVAPSPSDSSPQLSLGFE